MASGFAGLNIVEIVEEDIYFIEVLKLKHQTNSLVFLVLYAQ
jgi:hypothetical protein